MRWHSRGGRSLFLANSESPSFVTGPSATKVSHPPGRLAGHAGRHESRPAPSRRETVPGSARSLRGPAALLAHLVAGVSRRIAGVLRLIVRGVERLGAHITCVVRRLGALVALRLGIVLALLLCRSAGRSARGQVTGERCVAREPRHPLVQLALRAADRLLQVCLPLAHVAGHVALPLGQRLVACKASTRCDALDGAPAGFAAVDARRPPHASRNFAARFSRNAATPSRKSAVPAASTWLRSSSAITSSRLPASRLMRRHSFVRR